MSGQALTFEVVPRATPALVILPVTSSTLVRVEAADLRSSQVLTEVIPACRMMVEFVKRTSPSIFMGTP